MPTPAFTRQFRRDRKRILRSGRGVERLDNIIRCLARGENLPQNCRDHALTGDFRGHRECHLGGDWLLVYKLDHEAGVITFERTGSHAELFD